MTDVAVALLPVLALLLAPLLMNAFRLVRPSAIFRTTTLELAARRPLDVSTGDIVSPRGRPGTVASPALPAL